MGDTYNDIPMLDIVGHSYVMGNAAEHMHAHGKFLAPTNNEAGVLTVIDRIVYNDIPMLDIVGHSYVMGNAAEHMHAHGKFLAPTNNEAGVLTVIDRIV